MALPQGEQGWADFWKRFMEMTPEDWRRSNAEVLRMQEEAFKLLRSSDVDIAKEWQGEPLDVVVTEKGFSGRTYESKFTMEKGMSADSFRNVPDEPEMVFCTVYRRCMTWENVKLPRAGFEKQPLKSNPKAKSSREYLRDTAGRFSNALGRLAGR